MSRNEKDTHKHSLFLSHNAIVAEIQMEDVLFNNKGVNLSGTLIYPEGTETMAAVIFVDGS
jgi:hypothetical protein